MVNNLFIDFLPPWVETGVQPAFYDKESGTVLQQTARMYAKVNELTESVNHYIEQFTELYDYVHDYFDNLNVQEEINNKLDEMSRDGSLETLIGVYIQPRIDEQNEVIDDFKDEVRGDIAEINSAVTSLASGTPIPVSSVSDMTDTSKVYVNTDNGKWYYYDGDSWEIGGTYQTTGIGDGSIDILKLDGELESNFIMDFGEELDQGEAYVGWYGVNGTLHEESWASNKHVALTAGKIYNFTGRNITNLCSLVVKDSSNNVVLTSDNGNQTANVQVTFKCNSNNLTAYISYTNNPNNLLMNYPIIRELSNLTNALKYSTSVPLVKTYQGFISATQLGNNNVKLGGTDDSNNTAKVYQMSVGRTYHISSFNYVLCAGYCIVDEKYDILEASSTSSVTGFHEVSLNYTPTKNGYIILSQVSSSYVPSITVVSNAIDVKTPNVLTGKKLAVTGDSICAGAGYGGGYAGLIALNNNMQVQNIAVGGGTVTSGTTSGGNNRFWINESIVNLDSDADYVLIEGGCNDSGLGVTMGTLTSGYGSSFDNTTYIGAFENMCYQLTKRFKGKKYGYVFVHQWTANFRHSNTDQETSYYWQAKKVLEKWCIPYIDLNIECPPLGYFQQTNADLYAIRTAYTKDGDGVHPNKDGYEKYYVDKITSFLKSL